MSVDLVPSARPEPSPPQPHSCAHCGLPVPKGLIDPDAEHQFCCGGCATVFATLREAGLDSYYGLRERLGEAAVGPAEVRTEQHEELDDPAFTARYVRSLKSGAQSCDLLLEGVHCGACVWLVERLPRVCPGVVSSRLSLRDHRLVVTWDPESTQLSRVARALDRLGYAPHAARDGASVRVRQQEDRRDLWRIGIAAACAGNVMLMAISLYADWGASMEAGIVQLMRWATLGLGLVSLAGPGAVFFRGAAAAIRTRTAHMDLPVALGLGAGGISGTLNVITGRGDLYFDSLTALVLFLLIGRYIQRRQSRRAEDAVALLHALTPLSARRVRGDGAVEVVSVDALVRGDVVEVPAGATVPVDGEIVAGDTHLDQALLTGETVPVRRTVGEGVAAGVVNLTTPIQIRTEATGRETRVGRLVELVERSTAERAPIVRMADRISGAFVATVIVLGGATALGWALAGSPHALDHAVALLIVACPCALGLATPLALSVTIRRAAERGILVKGGAALELLTRPGRLLLDKTGTLTEGRTALVSWAGDDAVKPLVMALEQGSAHHVARALCQGLASGAGAAEHLGDATAVTVSHERSGVAGRIGEQMVRIGTEEFVGATGWTTPAWVSDATKQVLDAGNSPVFVGRDNAVVAVAGVGDRLRPDAQAAITTARALGWEPEVLSGDHPATVAAVAARLGLPPERAHGAITPEEKLARVEAALAEGPVVMVGDGVNDAAALAAASVGIAVFGGAEASLTAASVYLSRPGLTPVLQLVEGAHRTVHLIRRCLFASLAYNATAVTLAACGLITPLLAAILMPASSLTVLSLVLASRTLPGEGPT